MRTTHRWLRYPHTENPVPTCEHCGLIKINVPYATVYLRIDWEARTLAFLKRVGPCLRPKGGG